MTFFYQLRVWQAILIAVVTSFAITFFTYTLQIRVTEIAPDPQSPIFIAYAFIASAILWLLMSIVIFYWLRALAQKRMLASVISGLLFVLLAGYAAHKTIKAVQLNNALLAAADPSTPPQQLSALVNKQLGYGYELDNRVAGNPSTPADTLVSLYDKENQIGTDIVLAANPNTPTDVLKALSRRDDLEQYWQDAIFRALQRNPRVQSGELIFDDAMNLQVARQQQNNQ